MESYEALSNAINRKTAVHAKALGLSVSSVSKWQEPSVDFTDSGAFNPLDRLETIINTALLLGNPPELALSPLFYLGDKFHFVPLLLPAAPPNMADLTRQLHKVVSEFGEMIQEASDALADGVITREERRHLERTAHHLLTDLGLFLKQVQKASK